VRKSLRSIRPFMEGDKFVTQGDMH